MGIGFRVEIPRRHRSTAACRSKGADNDNAGCAAVATDRHHVFAPVHDEASVGEYEGCVLIVRGLGFGVWGLGFGVWGLGFGIYLSAFARFNQIWGCLRFCNENLRCLIDWGLGFRVRCDLKQLKRVGGLVVDQRENFT